jgi:hypothetical protein
MSFSVHQQPYRNAQFVEMILAVDLVFGTEYQYIGNQHAMDFERDNAKQQANRKKHGVDFRTAAKVFLDPYVIDFEPHEKRKYHEL